MQATPLPLEDIILPSAISWWPLAWGWWLLLAMTVVLCSSLGWFAYRAYQQRQRWRLATHLLSTSTQELNGVALYSAVNTWLKLQAKEHYPAALSLHGEAWILFLNHSAKQDVFLDQTAQALSVGLYQPLNQDLNAADLTAAALRWLQLSQAYKQRPQGGSHD